MKSRLAFSVSLLVLCLSCSSDSSSRQHWWNGACSCRVGIEIHAGSYSHLEKPVELELDFPSLLSRLGISGEVDPASPRLVETGPDGAVIDDSVPFQLDRPVKQSGAYRLLFICEGVTDSAATRIYDLYFDTEKTGARHSPAPVDTLVRLEELRDYQGQTAYRISTPAATWYYHGLGGGFASIVDPDGNDWISFRPCCESDGEYRGIPNMWKFHPGYDSVSTTLEIQGPLSVRLRSVSPDGGQECFWDIFPGYARMTLEKMDSTYWFLYEGTPGGALDVDRDYNVISNGLRRSVAEDWDGDLPGPEWIYFGDDSMRRTLFLAHDDDDRSDQFWQMRGQMVVFGFGREYTCCGTYMDKVPATFTVGLAADSAYAVVSRVISDACQQFTVSLKASERLKE